MVDGPLSKEVGCVIQARMASTRLPGKVLMPLPFLGETSILAHICNQLQLSGGKVIVATSDRVENDPIEQLCGNLNVECFRGSEDDVFSRFLIIQKRYRFKYIFRFTADNPLIDLQKMVEFFKKYLSKGLDYAYSSGMPLGMNFEVFSGKVIEKAENAIQTAEDKEHVTLHFRRTELCSKGEIKLANLAHWRVTVDTPIDYAQLSLITQLSHENNKNGLELLTYIERLFPWLLKLNEGVLQNNNSTSAESELKVISNLAKKKGYFHAVKKLES